MRRYNFLLMLFPLAGCGWQSGRGVEVAATVVRDVTMDQVAENLLAMHRDPYAFPAHVGLGEGLVDRGASVDVGASPGINFRGIGLTGLSLSGQYSQGNNIKIDPITDVFPLQRLQLVYRFVTKGTRNSATEATNFDLDYRNLLSEADAALLGRLPRLEPGIVLFGIDDCAGNPTREVRLSGTVCFDARQGEEATPASYESAFRRRSAVIMWTLASMQFVRDSEPAPAPPAPAAVPGRLGPARPAPARPNEPSSSQSNRSLLGIPRPETPLFFQGLTPRFRR